MFMSISILQVYKRPAKGFVRHTIYSGYKASDEKMDNFVCSCFNKVFGMPDFDYNGHINGQGRQINPANENMTPDDDLTMEQILDNINNTPIGQVLKKIAALPEIRKEKVLRVRQELTEGKYNLNERLDIALDKVLEDLTT